MSGPLEGPLEGYDALLLDLDGTVTRGVEVVPEAPDVVNEVRQAGRAVQFITNNASRAPDEIAEHLTALGVRTAPEEVLTSGQAAATLLTIRLPAGGAVLVVGAEALVAAVRSVGLRPVAAASERPAAVVQGHSPETGWARLAEACLAIRGGAMWIACNVDRTLPTERGLLPGNGAMVAALQAATDREPTVAGKPARPLLDKAVDRIGAQRPLVVGDRLETDIAGARAAGLDSLLVLSGVADAVALLAAPPEQRPKHLGADLRVLRGSLEKTRIQARPGWRVELTDGGLLLHGDGSVGDPLDALRALCAAWWVEHTGSVQVHACDDTAATVLDVVGLGGVVR
ncbi:MAG TPA: HAD-IIA family hydrolase [Pseudonocardiaceae bacterium]|nr:HAD-IIA family hydrolase [Pseudonocardiaceae bacterium]